MTDTAPTPEESAKAHNLIKALQDKVARQDARSASVETRRERAEMAHDPDAKKTRDLIRKGGYVSLPALVRDLIPFIGDRAEKHKLEEALENFLAATATYYVMEERPSVNVIDWMGGPNGQVALPAAQAPSHKRALVSAWHALLQTVNHLSKVGILKPPKNLLGDQTAIVLMVDLDETAPLAAPQKWD